MPHHDHDHHHHHNHDHDHSCTDPNCACHHDHRHSKQTVSLLGGTVELDTNTHEGAAVCTASCQWPAADRETEYKRVASVMQSVAQWVMERDGFIGHIKASVTYSESNSFSITYQDLAITPAAATVKTELAAIAFGVEEASLQNCILEAFRRNS